jgi:hypothetical protein
MVRLLPLLLLCALRVHAVPFGSISGHCGSVAIDHIINGNEFPARVECEDRTVTAWSFDGLPFTAELVAVKDEQESPADAAITLRTDILYELQVPQSGNFVACFDVFAGTYAPGARTTGSQILGPWSTATPCDRSHAIPVIADEWTPMISRTYLHAEGGANVILSGNFAFWDMSGQEMSTGFALRVVTGLLPVPEPSSRSYLIVAAAAAILAARHRMS